MVDPTPSDYNLTYLRERWERDKSSRIFLQLAEEYRRRGLHAEALEVLETGLGFHPGYLAAQVALGRCRLEAGQPEAAVKVLERVLTQDPTQAVATRLLAESWLQLGDEERAQAAIDRCRLIGIPPSELVSLEQRLAAARRATRDRWEPAASQASGEDTGAAPANEPADETSFAWQAEPEPEPQPRARPEAPPLQWEIEDRPAAAAAATQPDSTPSRGHVVSERISHPAAAAGEPAPLYTRRAAAEPAAATAEAAPPQVPTIAHVAAAQPAAAAAEPASSPSPRAVADAAAAPGHVFSLPPRAARGVVLPLRPGAERRVVGARGNPFGSVGRPRPRPPEAAEIFRLVPPPAPPAAAPALSAAPSAAPAMEAPIAPSAAPTPAPVAIPETPASQPAAASSTPAADRWWTRAPQPAAAASATPAPAAASAPPPSIAPAPAPPAVAAGPAARPSAPEATRWWERPTEAPPLPAAPAPQPAPAATVAAPPATPAPIAPPAAPAPAPQPIAAAPATSPAAMPPPVAAPPPAARSPLAASAGVEVQPAGNLGAVVTPELRPSDPGTATLGELYLRQGYVREAEEIFKQVLARDAENEAALAGLEAIGRQRAQKLTAAELIAGDESTEVRGLTARKIQLLNRYLGKLRPRAKA